MATKSDFHFYTDIFTKIDAALQTYVNGVADSMIGAFTPVATTLLMIYVSLWGWSMMRGVISEPVTDGISRIVRLSVITGIALSLGNYTGYVSDFLWSAPDALAKVVTGAKADSNVVFLDTLMSGIYDLGSAYWVTANAPNAWVPDIGMIIIAILIWFCGLWATAIAAFLLVLSKMALAVLLGVGPLFILCTIFEPSKKLFDAWLGQVLNFVFMVMLTAACCKLILKILQAYLAGTDAVMANPGVAQAFPCLVLCAICALVLMQMPSIASALGGGVAVSTLGAVGWAYNKMKGSAAAGRDLATGKTLSRMRGNRREKHVNKQWAQRNPGVTARTSRAIYEKISGGKSNQVRRAN